MEWLRKIIQKLFRKNDVKLIETPKKINTTENIKKDFLRDLRQQANSECDDGNGYKIAPILKLKDMI